MTGIYVLDKPAGMTSLQAAKTVARLVGERTVGHGGTLDPAATGVLPICLGEATKLASFLLGADKTYEAEIVFGIETDTLDGEGQVKARTDARGLTRAAVRDAMAGFLGPIVQVPPMYSAIRMKGRRLYDLARAGIEVERQPRPVEIHGFALVAFESLGETAKARVSVHCSKGTYIRVLAADLGRAVGQGAHLFALRRTRSGPFSLAQAVGLGGVTDSAPLPLSIALPEWMAVSVDPGAARRIAEGRQLRTAELGIAQAEVGTRVKVLTGTGDLVALAEVAEVAGVHLLRLLRGFHYGLTPEPDSTILRTH